jgi:hypothetical protein
VIKIRFQEWSTFVTIIMVAARWSVERETSLGLVKDASWRGKRILEPMEA